MTEIAIKVNEKTYANWTSLSIHRSVDEYCGSFMFTSTDSEDQGYPVKAGDEVVVLIDNNQIVTGYVDRIYVPFDIGSHEVSVAGRDNVQDLIDGDIPNNWKTAQGVTKIRNFVKMCEFIIKATGNDIDVVNTAGTITPFTDEEIQEAESGQKAMDFLSSFARKRNLYLNTDGKGNFRIYRPESIRATDDLIFIRGNNSNNILGRNYTKDLVERYNKITVRSQENASSGFYDFEAADASGYAIDSEIRTGRQLDFTSEESMTAAECKKRAEEQINILRARSIEYSCRVAGAVQSDGTPWDYGLVTNVVDERAEINGEFFIKQVTITRSIDMGTITNLVLVPPDAFKVKAELTVQDTRKSSLGKKYNR